MKSKILIRIKSLLMIMILAVSSVTYNPVFASAYGIVSSDPRVIVGDESIAVVSDTVDDRYMISSNKLLELLSVDDGSELEYVDSNGMVSYADSVESGSIRITSPDGRQNYVPISRRGPLFASEFGSGCSVYVSNGSTSYKRAEMLGGKPSGDTSYIFKAGTKVLSGFDRMEYKISDASVPYTYVFNLYADGDAIARVNTCYASDGYQIFEWYPDGTYKYNKAESGSTTGTLTYGGTLERARWHQVAIVYDSNRLRFHLYIDGNLITNNTFIAGTTTAKKINFGIAGESFDGIVAYDDLEAYHGYFFPSEYAITHTVASDTAVFDVGSEMVYYDKDILQSGSQLRESLLECSDATTVGVYADKSFSSDASLLNEKTAVVATSSNGKRYFYFGLSDDVDSELTLTENSGIATAQYYSKLCRTLILAAYDGNKLVDISFQKATEPGICTAELFYDSDYEYKAFVRKNDLVTPLKYVSGSIEDSDDSTNYDVRSIVNNDFESELLFAVHENGSSIKRVVESNGNGAAYLERLSAESFHFTTPGAYSEADSVVYEFDVKITGSKGSFTTVFKDSNAAFYSPSKLQGSNYITGTKTRSLSDKQYHNIAYIFDYALGKVTWYFDRNKVQTSDIPQNFALDGAWGVCMRFHPPTDNSYSGSPDGTGFYIDNVKIYESDALLSDVGQPERKIRITSRSVFDDDNYSVSMESGDFAIHSRSGIMTYANKKYELAKAPYFENGSLYVDADEIKNITGKSSQLSGYVTADALADSFGLKINKIDSEVNDGAYVFSAKGFNIENTDNVQAVNDYFFYMRPEAEAVYQMYNQLSSAGVHPRIQATKADFDNIRNNIPRNEYLQKWSSLVIARADKLLNVPGAKYEIRDGVRLLYVSREVLSNMYVLGMAYQITGDNKYALRAWKDLEAVCSEFPDWHPSHDIDLGEMCAAIAVGYDWMYDAFSPRARRIIEEGMYRNGLYEAAIAYQMNTGLMGESATGNANHNVVCSGGITMAALALMDVYPEECSYIVSKALRAVERPLPNFAPDGAWFEGPHYWEYTMQYTAKMLSTLDSAMDSTFSLEHIDGISDAARYMIYMQSSEGIFNYGDGGQASIYTPEFLWLSGKYNDDDVTSIYINKTNGDTSDYEDIVLSMLWYDTHNENGDIHMPLDKYYSSEDTMSMRQNWNDDGAFVGIHAGKTNLAHSQLDGASFVYDYDGIRWAIDPGSGDYNLPGYWDNAANGRRWQIFKNRAEAHNTISVNPSSLPDHIVNSYVPLTVRNTADTDYSEADKNLCKSVGIPDDLSTHTVIKNDGKAGTSSQKNMENTQILNLGNSIAVFSSPWNVYYKIDAATLIAAVLNSKKLDCSGLTTSAGYTLSYIAPGTNTPSGAGTVVNGGYLRAEKSGEKSVDIPIVCGVNLAKADGPDIANDLTFVPSGTSLNRSVGGIGGKEENDVVYQFSVNAGTTISSSHPARSDMRGIDTLNTPKTAVTVEFDMYVSGDAISKVYMNGGLSLMSLSSDGTMTYKSFDAGKTDVSVNIGQEPSWHKFAITYDYAGNRIVYYVDGKKLQYTGDLTMSYNLSEIRFGLENKTYINDGFFAVDNLRICRGYYDGMSRIGTLNPVVFADTTHLLYDVSDAKRAFCFADNRRSLVVRDELVLTKESDVYWFMQTYADVVTDETGATLTSEGKQIRLDFVSDSPCEISVSPAAPLPTSPVVTGDSYGNAKRIAIKLKANGNTSITVKLTPCGIDATSVEDYNISSVLW